MPVNIDIFPSWKRCNIDTITVYAEGDNYFSNHEHLHLHPACLFKRKCQMALALKQWHVPWNKQCRLKQVQTATRRGKDECSDWWEIMGQSANKLELAKPREISKDQINERGKLPIRLIKAYCGCALTLVVNIRTATSLPVRFRCRVCHCWGTISINFEFIMILLRGIHISKFEEDKPSNIGKRPNRLQ